MRKALVFAGQGSHQKGMCMSLVSTPSTAALWERMKDCMMRNYGVSLQDVIQQNPNSTAIYADALDAHTLALRGSRTVLNTSESTKRKRVISNKKGVMQFSYMAQPCVLGVQMLTMDYAKAEAGITVGQYSAVAGHSLGEFSALTALGVFSIETALNLTFQRGLLMERALENWPRGRHLMVACNPVRAQLHDDPSVAVSCLIALVEEIADALRGTTSFLEIVNYNRPYMQYVVAGDAAALAVLGKCLDPQFRANSSRTGISTDIVAKAFAAVKLDKAEGIALVPAEAGTDDFVTSAGKKYGNRRIFRRFMKGPDDGFTPAIDQLSHLTLEDDGRSGLKRKSWFVPLSVDIPFHTSSLRQCSDVFLPIVLEALPEEDELCRLLSARPNESGSNSLPVWVTNLTGTVFQPFDISFQESVRNAIQSTNVGEVQHNGRYTSNLLLETFETGVASGSVRDICATVLSAQMSHAVEWIESMRTIVSAQKCGVVHEISAVRTTSEFFKHTAFVDDADNLLPPVVVKCFPSDFNSPSQ